MPEIVFSFTDSVNFKKIEEVLKKCKTEVALGWRSGQPHTPAKNADGDYKGYHGENAADIKPMECSELAKDLYYGTAAIPARPFFDDALNEPENREFIQQAIEQQLLKIANGQKPNWDKVGTMAVGMVQDFVRSGYYKTTIPNSPKTIEYKGSDTPLIDSGNLINSLTYEVTE